MVSGLPRSRRSSARPAPPAVHSVHGSPSNARVASSPDTSAHTVQPRGSSPAAASRPPGPALPGTGAGQPAARSAASSHSHAAPRDVRANTCRYLPPVAGCSWHFHSVPRNPSFSLEARSKGGRRPRPSLRGTVGANGELKACASLRGSEETARHSPRSPAGGGMSRMWFEPVKSNPKAALWSMMGLVILLALVLVGVIVYSAWGGATLSYALTESGVEIVYGPSHVHIPREEISGVQVYGRLSGGRRLFGTALPRLR